MRYAVYESPLHIAIKQGASPNIETPQDILIRVCYVGICSDDIPFYLMDESLMTWPFAEAVVGHEFSGIVEELGPEAANNGFKKGDFVSGFAWHYCGACDNCRLGYENHCINVKCTSVLADYIVMNQNQLIVIPQSVGLKNGTLTDPVSYSLYNCMKKMKPERFKNIMIMGIDAMSLVMVQIVKKFGAENIVVIEPDSSKHHLASDLGATQVLTYNKQGFISKAMKETNYCGYDLVFEMSRDPELLFAASQVIGIKGTILYSYMYGFDVKSNISLMELYLKEAELHPFFLAGNILPRTVNIMKSLILEPLISKIYPLSCINDAFEAHMSNKYVKILIDMRT